jgi:hypothetical protein
VRSALKKSPKFFTLLAEFAIVSLNLKCHIDFGAKPMSFVSPALELFNPVNGIIGALASTADHGP